MSEPITGRIGKYKVEKELGAGGFGKVYLAFDPDVGQPVAIKKLRAGGDPDLLKRFQMEIRTTASLRHKNIVTIHASGEDSGDPYLVMEYLEGATLKQVIQERRSLTLLEKVSIMAQVADGLAYAHAKGVVHRDVKPENIMLMPDDNVKIMDFGIALGPERNTNVTQTGGIIGTPPYFAPEQLEGSKANEQTDIFSFGDVCYELLTWHHPFEQHKGEWRTLQLAILSYEPRSLGELLPGCPEALETMIQRTLAKQPEFRYQKFEEVKLDCEAIMVDLKHESAAEILREIPPLMESGFLQSALAKIRQAYQLEPGNREIRRLREEITLRIQGEHRQKQVEELLANADKQMNDGRFAEAVQSLELGYKLDSNNIVVAGRLEEAKARRDSYAQANRLLSEARFNQQKGFLTEAHQKVREALAVDPDNTDAQRLSQRIGDELSRRQLEQKLQDAMRTAREHRKARRYHDALAVLEQIEREVPEAVPAAELRADIQNELAEESRRVRAERFNLAVNKTREVMDAGDLDRARQMLEHLLTNMSSEPGAVEILPVLRDHLARLVRARAVAQYQDKARALLADKAFRPALDLLAEARREFPDDVGLERLNQTADELHLAQQRSDAVAAALREATGRRDTGDLQGALDSIAKARRQLGDEAALTDLSHLLEMELARQRHSAGLNALLKEGRALLSASKYAQAIDRLVAAKEFAGEAEVRTLLESARSQAAVDEEQRFVEQTLAAAGKLQSEEAWSKALSAVEVGLGRYPNNSRLAATADRLRERVERERQRGLIEAHRAAIRREIEGGRWGRAKTALNKAIAEFPAAGDFHDLSDQIEAGLYEEGWREFENRVNQKLVANSVSQAEQHLGDQSLRTIYATDPRWKLLAEQVAKRRGYEDALGEAKRQQKAGALSEAEALLTRVINQGPPDTRAVQMRGAIQTQQSEAQRQREIIRIGEAIRGYLKQDNLTQALAELTAARSRYPGEASWAELQAQVDARQQIARRKEETAKAEENIRQALSRDDLPQATALLDEARSRLAGEAVWADLDKQIQKRRAVQKQQAEISAIAENVRRRLGRDYLTGDPPVVVVQKRRDDLEKSAKELEDGRRKYPGDKIWETLRSELAGRRALLDAEGTAAKNVAAFLERREFDQADAQIATASKTHSDPEFWALLASGVEQQRLLEIRKAEAARQAALARQAEIEELARGLHGQLDTGIHRRLLPEGKTPREAYPMAPIWEVLNHARLNLAQARAKYPGEAIWDTAQAEIAGRATRLEKEITDFVRACPDLASLDANARQLAEARSRFPGETFWPILEAEIHARREPLERASIAQFEGHIREALQQGDFRTARLRLDAARAQHPAANAWLALQSEIDERQAEVKRREELEAVEQSVREHLDRASRLSPDPQGAKLVRQCEAFQQAAAALDAALAKYAGEARLAALKTEVGSRRTRWEKEVAQAITETLRSRPAKGFSARPIVSEIALLCTREPAHPLWKDLKAQIDALEALLTQQAEVAAVAERVRASLQRDDIVQAVAACNAGRAKYPDAAGWSELQSEIDGWQARQQQKLRDVRDQARDRLLALEGQLGTEAGARQLKKLVRQARDIAAGYPQDAQLVEIAARIQRRVEAVEPAEPPAKPIPWKWAGIGGGAAAALALVGYLFLGKPTTHDKPVEPPKPPVATSVSVEVRTDPPGAAIKIGDRSCVTPNCRLDLAPGSYQVAAQLEHYEPKQQSVQIDASNRTVDLTLIPIPPPKPSDAAATGTLLLQAGVPDALVYVDNVPQRNRTDASGGAILTLEAKAHEVRVERNGYETAPAQRVSVTSGGHQNIAFRLIPRNDRIELNGAVANVELRVDGSPVGRTDGSAKYAVSVPFKAGNRIIEVNLGRLPSGSRSLTRKFEPGETASLDWKPDPAPVPSVVTPPTTPVVVVNKGPTPEELEERDWDKVRDTTDPAQLRDFRKKWANGRHAKDAEAAEDRIVKAAAALASVQLSEQAWKNIDPNNLDQLKKFADEYPNSPHAREAQRKLDQVSATQDVLRKQVVDALSKLNVEFSRKPVNQAKVKETWPGVPKLFLESLKMPGQEITLTPIEEARVQGDTAIVRCNLATAQGRVKSQMATVSLRYGGGRWVITDLKVSQ